MAADVTKEVVTKFSVVDMASDKAAAIAGTFESLSVKVQSLTSMINPLNMAIGALGAGLSFAAIMKAGSSLEDMRINMAQTLTFMGEGGKNFSDALQNSETIMRRVVAEAGPLPGNAMDYASALQMAGTVTQRATGDFEKSYDLIKKTTAVSIAMGGSATWGATELNRMLNAGRGLMHQHGDFNMKMINAFRTLPGHANMTVHEFNKLDVHKRLALVTAAMGQFDDMVNASSHSWTAVKGAIESTTQLLTAAATKPIFENAKRTLEGVNSALIDVKTGKFTELGLTIVAIGNVISQSIVGGFRMATELAGALGAKLTGMANGPFMRNAGIMIDRLLSKGGGMFEKFTQAGPQGQGMATGGVSALLGGAGPLGVILGAGFGAFLADAEAVRTSLASLTQWFDSLMRAVDPIVQIFSVLGEIVGAVFIALIPPLMELSNVVMAALVPVLSGVAALFESVWHRLSPIFEGLLASVGALITSLAGFLGPVITLVGGVMMFFYDKMSTLLMPVISAATNYLKAFIDAISFLLSWLGSKIGFVNKALGFSGKPESEKEPGVTGGEFNILKTMQEAFERAKEAARGTEKDMIKGGKKPEAAGAPETRGGTPVQDFRFSRFQIEQKFAEGFDPDRIAVLFASDLGRLGEQKLQSSFAPAFGLR